ncbi:MULTISPECIES: hypothetical protein [Bradyrhizobium]|uniref:hypothetical protein n=1 Tax=Bradyrhizobium TaxID=374 RepID=UPI000686F307|nr:MULTISPECIES: hypothetical protein [Bradyrhizobium]QOG18156.1 hypothetical protein FOM02_13140 [Bradyrhizobium sp. SEMIA]UFW48534.1 hypothetical protein BaraCB756_40845 [Bradyrhizobium arachidis]
MTALLTLLLGEIGDAAEGDACARISAFANRIGNGFYRGFSPEPLDSSGPLPKVIGTTRGIETFSAC